MIFSSIARNSARSARSRFAAGSSSTAAATTIATRSASGGVPAPLLHQWYNIFGKSTIGYATWLVAGIVVAEGITGSFSDMVWNTVNNGRTYETIDWSKFKTDDDDEDEDDDDDEEEEEEEEVRVELFPG
ncbi:hypothetical protein THAOC_03940 [Thalassiosira oceanica]|uniref:Uncharacterized protein n=1 Tax=Thalassiosira oceanica TaxID=159749 RepID=K0TPD7_THAOC|nr:hypothetical protein THAOC_03940 [Thalassiosira oceanica]|eukprot:EJK74387.1 hypothetical protein THAOC_03940 [Thalassiosira oceanica]